MRSCWLVVFVALWPFVHAPASAASSQVEEAVKLITTFCVAGGDSVRIVGSGEVEGGFALKKLGVGVEGTLEFTTEESKGLVRGLQNEINELAAEQQSEARRCMQPYIDRLVNLLIGAEEADLPVMQAVVRTQWFSSDAVLGAKPVGLEAGAYVTACVRAPDGWSLRAETAHFADIELQGDYDYGGYSVRIPSQASPTNSSVVCGDLVVRGLSEASIQVTGVLKVQGSRHEGLHFN